ncbi:hypothetical protein ACJX0J_037619, partial [Zea mays]
GWPRRTADDPPGAATSARRTAGAEEDEAPGDPADGAVAVGGERCPPQDDEGAAEGLHGAVPRKRQARDEARSVHYAKRSSLRGEQGEAAAPASARS